MRETRTEKKYISKIAFNKWVKEMHEQFINNPYSMRLIKENCIYVYLRSKVGFSKCAPNDKWNSDIGTAYAWARCTGQPEYYEKKKYNLKEGEWVYISTIDSKIRCLLKYMCEGVDHYCFKSGHGELTLVKKTDITDITPAD